MRHPLVMGNWKLNGSRHMVTSWYLTCVKSWQVLLAVRLHRTTGNVHRYGEA